LANLGQPCGHINHEAIRFLDRPAEFVNETALDLSPADSKLLGLGLIEQDATEPALFPAASVSGPEPARQKRQPAPPCPRMSSVSCGEVVVNAQQEQTEFPKDTIGLFR
jgi:hypothetical protein